MTTDYLYRGQTVLDRFWARVNKTDTCWLWTGYCKREYGAMSVNNRAIPVHRFAYETFVGPIPDGLVIDHLCRVTLCVNPAHLEPVTVRENNARGNSLWAVVKRQGVCKRGHPWTPENTHTVPSGANRCRACHLIRQRAQYQNGGRERQTAYKRRRRAQSPVCKGHAR